MTTLRTKKFSEFFREASNKVLPQQECSEKKERYDTCFINWYSESTFFLSSSPSPHHPPVHRVRKRKMKEGRGGDNNKLTRGVGKTKRIPTRQHRTE
jgi:hypothetical protein